jgi:hypothetical protein
LFVAGTPFPGKFSKKIGSNRTNVLILRAGFLVRPGASIIAFRVFGQALRFRRAPFDLAGQNFPTIPPICFPFLFVAVDPFLFI